MISKPTITNNKKNQPKKCTYCFVQAMRVKLDCESTVVSNDIIKL